MVEKPRLSYPTTLIPIMYADTLKGLTRHEIRLRAPFDPLPYSALADSCERFFEYLVSVRQSALYFHPKFIRDNDEAIGRLLIYRRDAVAAIMGNLYTLAGALRTDHKVPVSVFSTVSFPHNWFSKT